MRILSVLFCISGVIISFIITFASYGFIRSIRGKEDNLNMVISLVIGLVTLAVSTTIIIDHLW